MFIIEMMLIIIIICYVFRVRYVVMSRGVAAPYGRCAMRRRVRAEVRKMRVYGALWRKDAQKEMSARCEIKDADILPFLPSDAVIAWPFAVDVDYA